MGFAVRVRSAGQKYGPTCHQRDRADVTEFVTLVRLSSLGQHVGVLALAGYKRRKSALTAGPIRPRRSECSVTVVDVIASWSSVLFCIVCRWCVAKTMIVSVHSMHGRSTGKRICITFEVTSAQQAMFMSFPRSHFQLV